MGRIVYAAAMSHVLYPDYYGQNVGPHGRRMVEELIGDPRQALAGADLSDEEREAFVRWDARKLNELGGSLHLLLSIPGLGGH